MLSWESTPSAVADAGRTMKTVNAFMRNTFVGKRFLKKEVNVNNSNVLKKCMYSALNENVPLVNSFFVKF